MNSDNLEVPTENLKEVFLHLDESIVIKGAASDLQELVDAWVGLFQVLSTDKHRSDGRKLDNIICLFALAKRKRLNYIANIRLRKVRVIDTYTVMESLWLEA